ncbi:MAG: hypothetical protein PHQ96_08165, partial [Candidatus Omnitrophica bacterium]|nr:hypothetical protein [Candidatus Omnitrophota bacterium]
SVLVYSLRKDYTIFLVIRQIILNIVLIGEEKDEISYLLCSYLNSNKTNNITYIHLSNAYGDRREFFKSVVFSLLNGFINQEFNIDSLINSSETVIPLTAHYIKDVFKKGTFSFLESLEIINKFINETGKKCIFIIEEFLDLSDSFPSFYQDFSKFIILQRDCMIVLTASRPKDAEKALGNELNLLFGNFEKNYLNERVSISHYLYLKILLTGINPSPLFISFFVNILGSNIIYYDLISRIINETYCAEDEVGSILLVLERSLYTQETYLFQRFLKKIDFLKSACKDFPSTLKLLLALSDGYLREKELGSLGIFDTKNVVSRLEKLTEINYIINYGNIYKIKDNLFSFWLSRIFKIYFLPSFFDSGKRNMCWRKQMEEEIANFKAEFLKDKVSRVLQLMSSFKNDVLRTANNKYTLPLIERTKILSYPDRNLHVFIGEGREIIFAAIKEGDAEDNDIIEFLDRGSNLKGKRVKKIFISTKSFSSAAQLIAKNHKLILWDANDINRLLAVYNRPIVPLEQNCSSNIENANSGNF